MSETIAYYPGCSLHGAAKEYDYTCRHVLGCCGVQLQEVRDWSCCGASPAHGTSEELAVALPLRNLIITEAMALGEVMTPCASCYGRLRSADHETKNNEKLQERMRAIVGRPYGNTVTIYHLVDYLTTKVGAEKIRSLVTKPLTGLKVASYYGCLLVRPPAITAVDSNMEDPQAMDTLVAATGAEPVDWPHKTECCGAGQTLPHSDAVERLVGRLVGAARASGADCIVAACPLCHANLDMRQETSGKTASGALLGMPILYISQLLGLAMGVATAELGLSRHFVDTSRLLAAVKTEEGKI